MNIQQIWGKAKAIFPKLDLKKEGGKVVLYNGTTSLIDMEGNAKYVEDQLKLYLMGLIHGKTLK